MLDPKTIEQIERDADEYARTFSGTRSIKRPYREGATAYATKSAEREKILVEALERIELLEGIHNPGSDIRKIATAALKKLKAL